MSRWLGKAGGSQAAHDGGGGQAWSIAQGVIGWFDRLPQVGEGLRKVGAPGLNGPVVRTTQFCGDVLILGELRSPVVFDKDGLGGEERNGSKISGHTLLNLAVRLIVANDDLVGEWNIG